MKSLTTLHVFAVSMLLAAGARADIFEWEYVNPMNPSLGVQQSTTPTPGGSGVTAASGADLYGRDLTKGYLIGQKLSNASLGYSNLTNADLSQGTLIQMSAYHATFLGAKLIQADLTESYLDQAPSRCLSSAGRA